MNYDTLNTKFPANHFLQTLLWFQRLREQLQDMSPAQVQQLREELGTDDIIPYLLRPVQDPTDTLIKFQDQYGIDLGTMPVWIFRPTQNGRRF